MKRVMLLALLVLTLWAGTAAYETVVMRKAIMAARSAAVR
jgi:hypothetical protein